jgi:hypothetical protein
MTGYKKFALTASVFLLFSLALCPVAEAELSLGSPESWRSGELRAVLLDTVSGEQGFWLERDYRTSYGFSLKATLMGGKGPVMHNIPPEGLDSDDGPLGSGGEYKTFKIGELPALIERNPATGPALAVVLDGAVLTLESASYGLSDDDLISCARALIGLM